MIWLAVCREKKCQWHRGAANKTTADVYAHFHSVSGHLVTVAAIPKGSRHLLEWTPTWRTQNALPVAGQSRTL